MSAYVAGSLVGGGFVVAGALIAVVREAVVRAADRRSAQAVRLAAAMRELLAALDAFSIEVEDQPDAPVPNRLDRLFDQAAKRTSVDILIHIFVRLLRRLAYGRRRDDLVDRLMLASNELRLIAPPGVVEVMRKIPDVDSADGSGSGWCARWTEARSGVRNGFRDELLASQRASWTYQLVTHLRRPRGPLVALEVGDEGPTPAGTGAGT